MKKYTIDLNNATLNADPVTYLYNLFDFSSINKKSFKTLYKTLIELKEDLYIEFIQFGLISESMMDLLNLFQDASRKNNRIHCIQSVL